VIRIRLSIIGFFKVFLRVQTDAPWVRIAAMTAGAVGFVTILAWIMVLEFPAGLLQDVLALPWPIG
jgi:putative tricarboxylic transport membrane protein